MSIKRGQEHKNINPKQWCSQGGGWGAVADPENFGGGGFEAQNLKNSDVFTKIESDFSAEVGNSNVFFAQIEVVFKKKKKVFTKIVSDFWAEIGNSNVFFAQIQVVSTKIESDFSPDSLR